MLPQQLGTRIDQKSFDCEGNEVKVVHVTNERKKIGHQIQRTDRVSYRRDQDAFVGSRYPAISEEPEE